MYQLTFPNWLCTSAWPLAMCNLTMLIGYYERDVGGLWSCFSSTTAPTRVNFFDNRNWLTERLITDFIFKDNVQEGSIRYQT